MPFATLLFLLDADDLEMCSTVRERILMRIAHEGMKAKLIYFKI